MKRRQTDRQTDTLTAWIERLYRTHNHARDLEEEILHLTPENVLSDMNDVRCAALLCGIEACHWRAQNVTQA